MRAAYPARWLLVVALAIHLPIAIRSAIRSQQEIYDFERYYEIGTNPARPYRDFPVEYPPGTVVVLRALAAVTTDRVAFGVVLVLVNAIADAAIVAALTWGWGLSAAACYALVVIPIVDLFYLRTDLWSTAAVAIAVAAWNRRREAMSAAALAAGVAVKLWPLPFFALLVVPRRGRMPWKAALAGGVAVAVAWLWVAGWSGAYQVLTFRGARGWEIESMVGSVWMALSPSSMRVESGAWRVGASHEVVSILMGAAAVPLSAWSVWRGGRTGHRGAGWIGCVSVLLILSATLSPQYAAWLAPGCAIAWSEGDRRAAITSALAILLTNLAWKSFTPLIHGANGALALLLVRNALLIVIAADAARLLLRASVRAPDALLVDPTPEPRQSL